MPKPATNTVPKRRGRKPSRTSIPESILLERNIATIGFFGVNPDAPSGAQAERKVSLRRTIDGAVLEAKATFTAPSEFGLPGTSDQDTYYALIAHVTEVWHETGTIPQVIALTPAELLHRMGKKINGKAYDQIVRSLKRIISTTIIAEQSIWLEGKKTFTTDVVRLFDRLAIAGTELEDGTVSARHTIWLSSWQIENLRQNYYLLLDYPTYRGLRYSIAKILFPMLKVWLYASRKQGRYEKRYDDLCNLLGVKPRTSLSLIEQQLGPSLDEFVEIGYIKSWEIVPAVSAMGNQYKIVLHHATDRAAETPGLEASGPSLIAAATSDTLSDERAHFVEVLESHGVSRREARRLVQEYSVAEIDAGRAIVEAWRRKPKDTMRNPAGYLVEMLRNSRHLDGEVSSDGVPRGPRPVADDTQQTSDINARAEELNRRIKEYESEIDRLMSLMSPDELADVNNRALERAFEEGSARQWNAEIREKQKKIYMRNLVAEAYGLESPYW